MSLKQRDVEALENTYAPVGEMIGTLGGQVAQYRGIPFAQAERFAMPRLVTQFSGECLCDGAASWQNPHSFDPAIGPHPRPLPMGDNCLTLKITAPASGQEAPGPHAPGADVPGTPGSHGIREDLPVLVFVHGGGYVMGSGSMDRYDPSDLVRQENVIVVNPNYRLGALGFLPLPGIAPANLGLWDVITGLRWVQNNIAAFGGDPANITLFGHSAGADVVANLLTMPAATPLFRRAIIQSAPFGLRRDRAEIAEAVATRFLDVVGVDPQSASGPDIVRAAGHAAAAAPRHTLGSALPYAPLPGENGLPEVNAPEAKHLSACGAQELMIGYTKHDVEPFILNFPRFQAWRKRFVADSAIAALARVATPVLTPVVFARGAHDLADAFAQLSIETAAPRRAFLYRFDWFSPRSEYRSCHSIELPFLLGTRADWGHAPMLQGTQWKDIEAKGRAIKAAWAAFARGGNPNDGRTPWPRHQPGAAVGHRWTR